MKLYIRKNICVIWLIMLFMLIAIPMKASAASYVVLNGCGDGTLYLTTGQQAQLSFSKRLETGVTLGSGNYNWYSTNASVASVTYSNGLVTANSAGTATIVIQAYLTINGTTSSNHVSDHCTVVVSNPTVCAESVTLNKTTATINVSENITLTATVSPSNANNSSITWTSSDPSIATVDNGVVTGLKKGNVTITASVSSTDGCSPIQAVANINVNEPVVCETDFNLDKTQATVKVGESVTLKSDRDVTWISSDPSIAIVDDGVVTGIKEGNATITAIYSTVDECADVKKDVEITVTVDRSLSLICESAIKVGDTIKLNYNYSSVGENVTYNWVSSDPSVISVDASGNIKALKFSTTPVKISLSTNNGLVDECSIELIDVVTVPPTAMNTSNYVLIISLLLLVFGSGLLVSVYRKND